MEEEKREGQHRRLVASCAVYSPLLTVSSHTLLRRSCGALVFAAFFVAAKVCSADPVPSDAKRFFAPPTSTYWAGSERIQNGELSVAMPRPLEPGRSLAPAPDDHLSTTAFLRGSYTRNDRHADAEGLTLTSVHDLPGGATASATFGVESRDRTAIEGLAKATIPMPGRGGLVLVPSLGVGGGGDFAPLVLTGLELWTDRRKWFGGTALAEVTTWTHDRTRVLGEVAGLARLHSRVAIEQRVALGAWAGDRVGGEVAFRWTSAALQDLGHAYALYERITLTRGLVATRAPSIPFESAFSSDLAVGLRRAFGPYGIVFQAFEGGQATIDRRRGVELTLYGTLL